MWAKLVSCTRKIENNNRSNWNCFGNIIQDKANTIKENVKWCCSVWKNEIDFMKESQENVREREREREHEEKIERKSEEDTHIEN